MQRIFYPSSELAPFIRYYWTLDVCSPSGLSHVQRIIPTGCPELLFYLRNEPVYHRNGKTESANAYLCGQQTDFYDVEVNGTNEMVSVVFQPWGIRSFFDFPAVELWNQSVPLELILKDESAEIEDRLSSSKSRVEQIGIIESWLLRRLDDKPRHNIRRLSAAMHKLSKTDGLATVDEMASVSCLSRKQMERVFADVVGLLPKRYLRIIRLQRSLHQFQESPRLSITEVAIDSGYYDQSHMIDEYKKFTGYTPGELLNICEPYSDFFSV
ncbi:helix-turn-helix domain-containing protein [Alkaliflexus imshenetskii]|uniref:helix-turn-helix domain-containing protein n=1 Tax=Alkaliflexus imshenetskii TaxID=286730 RepID=UPI0004790A74|nr:helix-turn-helix domain-containing protein [Alkaliflexus imshenetskii]